jgi:hypothetical protein
MIGIKNFLTAAVAVIAAAAPLGAVCAGTYAPPTAAEIPSNLLATLQKDLTRARKLEDPSCSVRSLKDNVSAWRFDLGRPEEVLLVEGIWPCLIGYDNAEQFLYIRTGSGWRQILEGLGQSLVVCENAVPPCPVERGPKKRSTGDWPDLELLVNPSVSLGAQLVYRFDGNAYKAIACNHVRYDPAKPRYSRCERGWEAQKTAQLPSGLLPALGRDLKDELKSYGDECLPLQKHFHAARFDLDRPQEAWLVEGIAPCMVAANNGEMFLYVRRGKGWHLLLHDVGNGLGFWPGTGRYGWPDLALYSHGSASCEALTVYRFDGKVYNAIGGCQCEQQDCVPEVREAPIRR